MPDRRARLPGGTRAASQRAVQKVFENEQALAELKGADRVRRQVRAVREESSTTVQIDGHDVEVVPRAAVEQALG